jgi:RHS repeat-associated protein
LRLLDTTRIVHSPRSTAAIGLRPDSSLARTTSSATESLLTDPLGSTIALAGSTAKAETTYTYDPFGSATKEGVASENPFQYAGRENDGDGLYDNRARYLSPTGARFISQDPLGSEANGPNLYSYVGNAPTNTTDPFGTTFGESNTEEEDEKKQEQEEAGVVPICEHNGENPVLAGPLPPGIGLKPSGPGGPGGDGGSQGDGPPETVEVPGGHDPRCEGNVRQHL